MRELKKPKRVVFPYQRRRVLRELKALAQQGQEDLERFIKGVDGWVAEQEGAEGRTDAAERAERLRQRLN